MSTIVECIRAWAKTTKHGEAAAEILDILNGYVPENPERAKYAAKKARSASVSNTLGRYRFDDGGKLRKARVHNTKYGPQQWGGYKVSGPDNSVMVSFVPPDDMLAKEVNATRKEMLDLYSEILMDKGYTVKHTGTCLFISY